MDRIHARLSDQATVVYIPHLPSTLWRIGQRYHFINHFTNPAKVPLFRVDGVNPEPTVFADLKLHYNRQPNFVQLARHRGWLQYSMVFLPGMSWFGGHNGISIYR